MPDSDAMSREEYVLRMKAFVQHRLESYGCNCYPEVTIEPVTAAEIPFLAFLAPTQGDRIMGANVMFKHAEHCRIKSISVAGWN